MNGALEARGRAIGAAAVARWRARVAAQLREVPGLRIEERDDGLVVTGRRLRARWLRDAALRWLGGWM
ncbi:MAG: hypothetical protein V4537_06965 [Pseudomonadota bacterium]